MRHRNCPEAGLDHHSYEAGEWTTIKDWADHLGGMRIPIVWGPGRHGPGNNLFIFIKDTDGNMIEGLCRTRSRA